jgi:hypothetical protein
MLKIHFQHLPAKMVYIVIDCNISVINLNPLTGIDVSRAISWLSCNRLCAVHHTLKFLSDAT